MRTWQSKLSAPAALLRQHDIDRFRFGLLAAAQHREAVFTLYAFNHEVAKTRESVSETMIGAIRLQWWRDSIDGIFAGSPRQHEIIEPLAACISTYGLPRRPFDDLINARERDLWAEACSDEHRHQHRWPEARNARGGNSSGDSRTRHDHSKATPRIT